MNEIEIVISEVKETITILQEQINNPDFIKAGGLLQIKSEELKLKALLEKQERENPKSLTLDELREMDGEPIYIVR